MAARVQPDLLDRELVDLFMSTLRGSYLQHMLSSTSDSFSDMVIIGERVEMCIKVGTITGASGTKGNNNSGGGKKPYSSGFVKKKEGEVSNASDDKGRAIVQVQYYQTPAAAPQQEYTPPRNYQPNQRPQGQRGQQRSQRYPERKLDPIPMLYAELLP